MQSLSRKHKIEQAILLKKGSASRMMCGTLFLLSEGTCCKKLNEQPAFNPLTPRGSPLMSKIVKRLSTAVNVTFHRLEEADGRTKRVFSYKAGEESVYSGTTQ